MVAERAPEKRVPIRIERMQLADVEIVAELDKKCFPAPWSAGAYANEVHNPSAYYVVARVNSQIVGYGGMWLIMDEIHITTLGVDPAYRGKKVGERILINLLDEAIHRGARRATLEVRESNEIAQYLYKKYGFRVAAIRIGYYTNNYEDAIVMWVDDMWDAEFLKTFRIRKEGLGVTS